MSARPVLRAGGLSLRWHPRAVLVSLALAIVLAMLGLALLSTGSLELAWPEIVAALGGTGDDSAARVVWNLRLPRIVTGLAVGACLGAAGAVFQSISRNPLGSPDVIGFMSGAATGAVVQIVCFDGGPIATAFAAVAGGLVTAGLVYGLSRSHLQGAGYRLILVGIGIGAVLEAVTSLLLTRSSLDVAISAQIWLTGTLNARQWVHAWPALAALLLLLPVVLWYARRLSLMESGDELAGQLGVDTARVRLVLLVAATGLTAVAVASTGPIAFVALAAPQLARRVTGATEVPVLGSALFGAALLLAADLAAQRLPLGLAVPVGLMTGVIGGVYLIWLLVRSVKA